MDPLTAGINLLTSINTLVKAIIDKSPPEAVGAIIVAHEARVAKIEAWLESKFHFLQIDAPK